LSSRISTEDFLCCPNWTRDHSRICFQGVELFHVGPSGLGITGGPSLGLFVSRPFQARQNLGNFLAGGRSVGTSTHPHPENKRIDLRTSSGKAQWNQWITGPKGHWTLEVHGQLVDGKEAPHGLQYINSNPHHNNARLLRNGTIRTTRYLAKGTEVFMAYGKNFVIGSG
jgi:hypothetical protein